MMIYLFTLTVFSCRHLPPPSLWAHLNNYYNPEECKLRGTHTGEKLGPWITHLHFPPRGIQTFILWSHPSFRDSNNEPLLHCIVILANKSYICCKFQNWQQVNMDILIFPPTFLIFPRSQNLPCRYNNCGENKAWGSWWLWRHLVTWLQWWSPTNGQEVIRQQLVSSDHQRRHGQGAPGARKYSGQATSGDTGKFSHHSSRLTFIQFKISSQLSSQFQSNLPFCLSLVSLVSTVLLST